MTLKLTKVSMQLDSSVACELTLLSHGTLYHMAAALVSTVDMEIQRTTSLNLNLESLEIPWQLGSTYSFSIPDGFVTEYNIDNPNVQSNFNITTPSTVPLFQSSIPANSTTGVLENITFILNFDRGIKKGSGNIYLYKNGSPDSLIYTINMSNTNRVALHDNQLLINVTGQFQQGNTYYILTDAGILKDIWNFSFAGISSEDTVKFTMATSVEDTNNVLREVANLNPQRRYIPAQASSLFSNTSTYNSNQTNYTYALTGTASFVSTQYKFGNASYYKGSSTGGLTVTPSADITLTDFTLEFWYKQHGYQEAAGYLLDCRNSSNSSTSTQFYVAINPDSYGYSLTIGGTTVGGYGTAAADYTWHHWAITRSGTELKVYLDGVLDSSNGVTSSTDTFIIRTTGLYIGSNYNGISSMPGYLDDLRISNSVKYTGTFTPPTSQLEADEEDYVLLLNFNLVNSIPSYAITKRINNTAPTITDLDIDPDLTYDVSLSCSFGKIGSSYLTTVSGSKSSVNSALAALTFTPDSGITSTGYVNYIQKRNGETRETGSFLLSAAGTNQTPISQGLWIFDSSTTWTPPADALLSGVKADILIVGGGGGGAHGGGGGGGVVELLNQTLTNQAYTITVGTGGARVSNPYPNSEVAGAGGATTAFDVSANGGSGGLETSTDGTLTPDGGAYANIHIGGTGYIDLSNQIMVGGGGASMNSIGGTALSTDTSGAAGGVGTTSTVYPGIFGQGGGGGYRRAWYGDGVDGNYVSTGIALTGYGSGGAGGYTATFNPTVLHGDGLPTSGKGGVVIVRIHR